MKDAKFDSEVLKKMNFEILAGQSPNLKTLLRTPGLLATNQTLLHLGIAYHQGYVQNLESKNKKVEKLFEYILF